MHRRTFLTGAAITTTFGLAGCLGGDETPERTDEEHVAELRSEIGDRGVDLIDIRLAENIVTVEHGYDEDPNDAIANVAMAFVERIAEEWDVERLDGYLREEVRNDWSWYVEATWARAYAEGEIGPDKYGKRIRDTLSRVLEVEG